MFPGVYLFLKKELDSMGFINPDESFPERKLSSKSGLRIGHCVT